MTIAKRLIQLREENRLGQKDVAKVLNIGQSSYSKYERGIVVVPIDNLCKIADFYKVSLDYLVSRTNIKSPYPTLDKKLQT